MPAAQACFYIPWALLQSDDFDAAVAARKAYVDYIDHVHALAGIALKAADGVTGAGGVYSSTELVQHSKGVLLWLVVARQHATARH